MHTFYNSDGTQGSKKKHSEIKLDITNTNKVVVNSVIPISPELAKKFKAGKFKDGAKSKLSVSITQ